MDAATGSFVCTEAFDCPATRFDSCLVRTSCWFGDAGACEPSTQLGIARFLQCFEGPFANKEVIPDDAMREPCMKSSGLDYDEVQACVDDSTALKQAQHLLNETRAPMYNQLGPNPGTFPHIFVDGEHLYNSTWAALVRIICKKAIAREQTDHPNFTTIPNTTTTTTVPDACTPRRRSMVVTFDGVAAGGVRAQSVAFERSVQTAANFAVSETYLPVNFLVPQPDGSPSYVNVQAISTVSTQTVLESKGGMEVTLDVSLLSAFVSQFDQACTIKALPAYWTWALAKNGFAGVPQNIVFRCSKVDTAA